MENMENKVRIYQLAKELNTTSKRLIEKLAEINIEVKNHMSLLSEEELNALYEHIGVVRKPDESAEKKEAAPAGQKIARSQKPEVSRGPTIIRKTEIILDDENVGKEQARERKPDQKKKRRDFVTVADDTSGLRAGLVRNTGNSLEDLKEMAMATRKNKKENEAEDKKPDDSSKKIVTDTRQKTPVAEIKPAEKKEAPEPVKAKSEEPKPEGKAPVQVQVQTPVQVKEKPAGEEKKVEDAAGKTDEGSDKAVVSEKTVTEKKPAQTADEKVTVPETPQAPAKEERPAEKKPAAPEKTAAEPRKDQKTAAMQQPEIKKPLKHSDTETKKPLKHSDTDKSKGSEDKKEHMKNTLYIPPVDTEVVEKDYGRSGRKSAKTGDKSRRDKEMLAENVKAPVKNRKLKDTNSVIPKVIPKKSDVSELLSDDFDLEEQFIGYGKRKKPKAKRPESSIKDEPKQKKETVVKLPDSITVKEFAERIKKSAVEVIKKLMSMGLMVTINEEIDFDTAAIIADEYDIRVEKEIIINDEDILFDDSEENEEDLQPRAPVVVVMGHVDHGKTSLLDAIRKANVTATEAGGITQHIGAYTVKINDRDITFLDTPGHEAFTAMRARGAQVTDIAILVVAADDGVMPQTIEAINHAKAANVTIIVAINKIDKPGANPDRVKQQLAEHGLVPEEWGGDTICVPISAKNHENIDLLLEMVLLTADMMELKANPNKQAKGTVIEAKLDKNRGTIATLLVQRGTLRTGDSIIAGTTVGRIRAMVDDKGREIESAGPSMPVEILGLPEVPQAGETFYVIKDEHVAKHLVETRKAKLREEQLKNMHPVTLEDLFNRIQEGSVKELNLIVKADVQGSVEALKQSLEKLSNDEVKVRIIHGAVGAITESDINLAEVTNAIVIGFNVRPAGANVTESAERAHVDVRIYRVIYNVIEDVEAAMKGMLEPTYKETVIGHAEVRQVFRISGVGSVAGSYVTDGKITRNSEVRLIRDGIVIYEGKLASLKRFKDDAREVLQGYECGIGLEKFNDIKEGDIIESFIIEQVER